MGENLSNDSRRSRVVLHVFKRGETFAEAAIFLGGRYPASGETAAPSRLLKVDGAAFRSRIEERPALVMSMLASASYQLKFLVEQIEQIKVRSAPQRIADFIVRMTQVRKGAAIIELPFEKGLLANRLGMKPESFSRALVDARSCFASARYRSSKHRERAPCCLLHPRPLNESQKARRAPQG
jgi:CRP-like cAMP-binding protein